MSNYLFNIIIRLLLVVMWGIVVVFGCFYSNDVKIALVTLYLCYTSEQILRILEE